MQQSTGVLFLGASCQAGQQLTTGLRSFCDSAAQHAASSGCASARHAERSDRSKEQLWKPKAVTKAAVRRGGPAGTLALLSETGVAAATATWANAVAIGRADEQAAGEAQLSTQLIELH